MLARLHSRSGVQLLLGLVGGVVFGFLLQKGGVTEYDVIVNQLLLKDFTVLNVMLTAMVTGMIGVHLLQGLRLARLHPKPGSAGATLPGALIFGIGFGTLGYCPGTVVGAVGHGALDALFGGVVGILLGAGAFAAAFPRLKRVLSKGQFGELTFPQLFRVGPWAVIIPVAMVVGALLWWLEGLSR